MITPKKTILGRHFTIEYSQCDSEILNDVKKLEVIFTQTAKNSGATVISSNFNAFNPIGVSGVVIIAESHFTVHTWPEFGYAAVDIFTCGETINFQFAISTLKKELNATLSEVSGDFHRGFVPQ